MTVGHRDKLVGLIRDFLRDSGLERTAAALEDEAAEHFDANPIIPNVPLLRIFEEWATSTSTSDDLISTNGDLITARGGLATTSVDLGCGGSSPQGPGDAKAAGWKGLSRTGLITPCPGKSLLFAKVFPGPLLLTAGTDKVIRAFRMDPVAALDGNPPCEFLSVASPSTILDFDLHGDTMIVACMDGSCLVVDFCSGRILQTFSHHSKYLMKCLFCSKDGSLFSTASHDKTVNFYTIDRAAGFFVLTHTISDLAGAVESLCWIKNPSTLVIGTRNDCRLHYVDLNDSAFAKSTRNLNVNGDFYCSFTPMDIVPSPCEKFLLVYTDSESGRLIIVKSFADAISYQASLYGPLVDGYSRPRCCWHSSGSYVFANSDDNSVWVFDVASGRRIEKVDGFPAYIRSLSSVSCGSSGDVLLAACMDGSLNIRK